MRLNKVPVWSDLLSHKGAIAGLFFSVAGLALLIVCTVISHFQLDQNIYKTERSQQAVLLSKGILSSFSEVRAHQQLFTLTGHNSHQQEAVNALAELEKDLASLIQLGEEGEPLRLQAEALKSALELQKAKVASTTVAPDVMRVVLREDSPDLALSTQLNELKAASLHSLTAQREAFYVVKERIWYLNVGTGLLISGMILCAYRLVRYEKRERLRTENNLIELNLNKDKFFSIVSHDLRGPAANIVKLSEFLQEEGLSAGDYRMMAAHLHKSAQSLHKLLENLLSWARLQMGRIECKPESIDLHRLVQECLGQTNAIAADKNITLENQVSLGAVAFADEKMCDTVLRNLVLNAIKFTHAEGEVRIYTAETEQYVELCVSDTGVGISPEVMSRLFKLGYHFTSKGTANESGSGLGLILCRELAEKNNGQISVVSEVGKGATFKVALPKIQSVA